MAPRKRPPSTSESGTPLAFAHRSKRPTSTGLQVRFGAARRTHLVGPKTKVRDSRRLSRVALGRHIHPGAAVEPDGSAQAAAEHLGKRHTPGLRAQVEKTHFHGAVCLGSGSFRP